MDYTKDMEAACELLHEQISDLIHKIKNSGMTSSDLDQLDKLTHSLKSVKGTMKMEEEDEEGYSGMYPYMGSYRGSYDRGGMGGSYARGRRNARRDSMGRYSSDGSYRYSGGNMIDDLRDLMNDAPDNETRQEMQRLIQKLEQR